MPSKTIVVTGFGPFRGHEQVNPSWEAVKLLPDVLEYEGKQYPVKKMEIPVAYAEVDRSLEDVWVDDPLLVIHCGVNSKIDNINLESNAVNGYFSDSDCSGKCLPCTTIPLCKNGQACQVLETQLNVNSMVMELNETVSGKVFERSDDVGNYLCCYIYLKSLDKCTARSLFIHVPPISSLFTPTFTSECIEKVIIKCIAQRCNSTVTASDDSRES